MTVCLFLTYLLTHSSLSFAHTHTHAQRYVCKHAHAHAHTHTRHTHTHTDTRTHQAHTCTHTDTLTHARTRHAHTHTNTHMHTQSLLQRNFNMQMYVWLQHVSASRKCQCGNNSTSYIFIFWCPSDVFPKPHTVITHRRCAESRKAVGKKTVSWLTVRLSASPSVGPTLQALVYDILPSTTAVFSYAIGSRKLSANELFFLLVLKNSGTFVTNNSNKTRRFIYSSQQSLHQHK